MCHFIRVDLNLVLPFLPSSFCIHATYAIVSFLLIGVGIGVLLLSYWRNQGVSIITGAVLVVVPAKTRVVIQDLADSMHLRQKTLSQIFVFHVPTCNFLGFFQQQTFW